MKLTSKNLYSYCDNNPVSKTDLKGNLPIAAMAIGAGINLVSSAMIAYATGEEYTLDDAMVSIVSGALGDFGKYGYILSMVCDCVYVAHKEGKDEAISNALFSVFTSSVPFAINNAYPALDDALKDLIDFGTGLSCNIIYEEEKTKHSSNNYNEPVYNQKRNEGIRESFCYSNEQWSLGRRYFGVQY